MGSGGNPIDELERSVRQTGRKWKKDPWNELGKAASNMYTMGFAKRDGNKWGEGDIISGTREVFGEFGGSNKARKEGYKTADMMREQEAAKELAAKEKMLADYRADLSASQGAQAIRESTAARTRSGRGEALGQSNDEDLLGL
jgi:hypothetical protein